MKDALGYYQILQVEATASAETIKKSYHNLAKIWHPDYNKDLQSTDIFQKISVAYEVLSDHKKRTIYDFLSLVYTKENYPDIDNMTIIGGGENVASVKTCKVISWITSFKKTSEVEALCYSDAIKKHMQISVINWLLGWWHFKGFANNINAIISNFKHPLSKSKTLQVNIHNMISCYLAQNNVASAKYGLAALSELETLEAEQVKKFVQDLGVKVKQPQKWNITMLRLVQLIVPFVVCCCSLFIGGKNYLNLSEAELWSLFSKDKEINYYQQVSYGNGEQSVDDMVVGKVISIPLDKSDTSKLYHLKSETKIMYGPSDDFDVIKVLSSQTTVRLTGVTPDDIWARVMIDNGEIGFVHMEDLVQGIGKEIPFGSSIIN